MHNLKKAWQASVWNLGTWKLQVRYMIRKWISPFGLYESLMWRNGQRAKSGNPEGGDRGDIILVTEAVCNGRKSIINHDRHFDT